MSADLKGLRNALERIAALDDFDDGATAARNIAKAALFTTPVVSEPEQRDGETFLKQLRRVNTERYLAWVGDSEDAGILFDAAELGGEVGELLNIVKKLEREARGWRGSRADPADFDNECADVLICLDKLARRRGTDLQAATIAKFNATSEKVGLPHRLVAADPDLAEGAPEP